jgi:hypothetical protein
VLQHVLLLVEDDRVAFGLVQQYFQQGHVRAFPDAPELLSTALVCASWRSSLRIFLTSFRQRLAISV